MNMGSILDSLLLNRHDSILRGLFMVDSGFVATLDVYNARDVLVVF